jgi:hypothetical protein
MPALQFDAANGLNGIRMIREHEHARRLLHGCTGLFTSSACRSARKPLRELVFAAAITAFSDRAYQIALIVIWRVQWHVAIIGMGSHQCPRMRACLTRRPVIGLHDKDSRLPKLKLLAHSLQKVGAHCSSKLLLSQLGSSNMATIAVAAREHAVHQGTITSKIYYSFIIVAAFEFTRSRHET